MKNINALLAALSVLIHAGCVSTANVPIPPARLADSAGSTVVSTSRPRPDFSAMRATNAMFGAIGGLASVSSGNDLIRESDVPDPAAGIAANLVEHLAMQFRLAPLAGGMVAVNSAEVSAIASAAGKAALVLDVQTVNWSIIYLPLNWTHYRLIYSVKLRLIDVRKRELIAEGFFAWQTPDGQNPTYDELFENKAAGLKRQLDEAAKAATEHFKAGILK